MKKLLLIGTVAMLVFASCVKKGSDEDIPTIPTYTVAFELNGGSGVEPITVDSGATVQPPAEPIKAKSCFLGWYSDSICTNTFDFAAPITANTIVYAKWSKRHTVTFVLNGGTGVPECHFCDSATILLPEEPTKEGYSFVNWCIDSAFSAPFKYDSAYRLQSPPYTVIYDTIKATKDTTLHAQWIDGEKIRRNLNNNNRFYWLAYEDEPGLYSNQTTGTSSGNGRLNTGGEANDVCRSKGDGWYLPAKEELIPLDSMEWRYWTSTQSGGNAYYWVRNTYGYSNSSSAQGTNQYHVRCVWRPLYEE